MRDVTSIKASRGGVVRDAASRSVGCDQSRGSQAPAAMRRWKGWAGSVRMLRSSLTPSETSHENAAWSPEGDSDTIVVTVHAGRSPAAVPRAIGGR